MDKNQREAFLNILENMACQLARQRGGVVEPHLLLPYLPVSMALVCEALDEMATDDAIRVGEKDGIRAYFFSAYESEPVVNGMIATASCVSCGAEVKVGDQLLCEKCADQFSSLLSTLAEKTGWPAEAVYEHEIFYLAAKLGASLPAEKLAGSSRYTLRRMRQKLAILQKGGCVRREGELFVFPKMIYPKHLYQANRQIIDSYPASLMEDVEHRVVQIMSSIGILFVLLLGLAFLGIPFPFLLLVFFVTSPILSLVLWRRKVKVNQLS